jgi:hypothetical protein
MELETLPNIAIEVGEGHTSVGQRDSEIRFIEAAIPDER